MPTLEDVVAFIASTDMSNIPLIMDAMADRWEMEHGIAGPEDMIGDAAAPLPAEELVATEEVIPEAAPTLPPLTGF